MQGKVACVEPTRKTSVIVLASVAAAAASIAVVVAVAKWRERSLIGNKVKSGLRGVQDVLADCYRQIDEIERHLPAAVRATPASASYGNGSSAVLRAVANGNQVLEN